MVRTKRRRRIGLIAGYLMTGAIMLQLGPACIMAGGTAMASSVSTLIDGNGRLLGLFNVCGQPNIVYVDAQGIPTDSSASEAGGTVVTVDFSGDDLMFGCPVTYVRTQ